MSLYLHSSWLTRKLLGSVMSATFKREQCLVHNFLMDIRLTKYFLLWNLFWKNFQLITCILYCIKTNNLVIWGYAISRLLEPLFWLLISIYFLDYLNVILKSTKSTLFLNWLQKSNTVDSKINGVKVVDGNAIRWQNISKSPANKGRCK